jgi:dTDP-4-amino-4,6-dideoxygalactose transaminase
MSTPPKVTFFGLNRQYQRYRQQFLKISEEVLASGQALQGPDVTTLEESLASICQRKYGIAVGSCTDALAFALMAAGVGMGDEVLITSVSFFASVSCIMRVGASPCFVDIEPDYYLMNTELLDDLVTSNTKAIIGVHLYGQTLPMDVLERFSARHGLFLIEDGAQSLGAFDNKRPVGNMGRISCLSFDPTKVVGSFSSGGAIVTDDHEIARKVRMLRYHGRGLDTKRYEMVGYNSQLSSEMAAMLVFKLSEMRLWEKERQRIAMIYRDGLSRVHEVTLPQVRPGSTHSLPIYPDLTAEEAKFVVDKIKNFYS